MPLVDKGRRTSRLDRLGKTRASRPAAGRVARPGSRSSRSGRTSTRARRQGALWSGRLRSSSAGGFRNESTPAYPVPGRTESGSDPENRQPRVVSMTPRDSHRRPARRDSEFRLQARSGGGGVRARGHSVQRYDDAWLFADSGESVARAVGPSRWRRSEGSADGPIGWLGALHTTWAPPPLQGPRSGGRHGQRGVLWLTDWKPVLRHFGSWCVGKPEPPQPNV